MRSTPKTTRHLILGSRTALLTLAVTAALYAPAHGQITQQWLAQWGYIGIDYGEGVAMDGAGRTWVAGYTNGDLVGTSAGSTDLFLTPLSPTGLLGTSVQRGGTFTDVCVATAVVGGSTVFGVGYSDSASWDGASALGREDALLVRYSTAGVWQGTTRFGSAASDVAYAASGNATNLLVGGLTLGSFDGQTNAGADDAFLSKRTSTGALVWTRTVGTTAVDRGGGVAFDSVGNAYLTGHTAGSLPTFTNPGANDLFLSRYDANGTRTLLKQWGTTGNDLANDVEVDGGGNIYVTGSTDGALGGQMNNGGADAFLTKLDSFGNVRWTRLFGGVNNDAATALAVDAMGNVWIGGRVGSAMPGHIFAGLTDAFVARYDNNGTLLDTYFWGTPSQESVTGLAAALDGSMHVSGYTSGQLGTVGLVTTDAWAASVIAVPEPATAALLLGGTAFLALRRRR